MLFALGGYGGGVSCYMKDGYLNYEYNGFIIERTKIKSERKLAAGATKIEILFEPAEGTIVVTGKVSIKVNGNSIGEATVPHLVNLAFSTEGFEVGSDEHAPVSSDYFGKGHFPFNGTIHKHECKIPEQLIEKYSN